MVKNQLAVSFCIFLSFVICALCTVQLVASEQQKKSTFSDSAPSHIWDLHAAAETHNHKQLDFLLENAKEQASTSSMVNSFLEGRTPLMRACFKSARLSESVARSTIKLLLEHGAQVVLQDGCNKNSLMYALQAKYGPRIIGLLAHSAVGRLDDRDSCGRTVFDYAAGSPELLAVLNGVKNIRS